LPHDPAIDSCREDLAHARKQIQRAVVMGVVEPRTHRAVWSYLRRTRQRLVGMAKELPAYAPRLGRVIGILATEEAALLAEDPQLPFRVNRGPKRFDPSVNSLTELTARISELETEVRIREEQVAVIAHDLRGPLSPVLLLARRLHDEAEAVGAGAMPAAEVRGRMHAICHRLDELVRKLNLLLDTTRLQTGDVALDPEELDLCALARGIAADLQQETHPTIPIDVRGPDALIGTWDRTRIEQILRNLLTNALRFGALQPIELVIDGAHEQPFVVIIVRDRGIGIAAKDHVRIFEKHARVGNSKGFGLGLWIVRELVAAMDGTVTVESAPGEGSTFRVTLPRSS
jgi:signal transduction histidine kinase